jgi:Na+-transporting methylmalonyl-CoA/oxaloacetate decarboxylase gamma subunit
MKRKILIFFEMFLLTLILLAIKSNAGYSSNDPEVKSGETITISIVSNENLQNYDLQLVSYNGLTYKGCSSSSESAAVNSGTGKIAYATLGAGTKNLGTYTFVAPEVTKKTTYKVSFKINDVTNTSTVTVNPKIVENNTNSNNNSNSGSNSNSTTQPQPQTKSNVATLANLGIKGQYDFTGFRAAKTSYSVTVPNEAESVEIYASKGQSGQKITGTGVKQLKEGTNAINVVVTAEDGTTTKTYTISIERKSAETTDNTEEKEEETSTEEQESFGLKELKIEGIEITPEFKTDIYEYSAELKEDKTSLELTTLPTVENAEIEVTGNEDLKDGENIITVIVKEKDTDKTATYQITVNKISNEQNITDTTINKMQLSQKKIIVICAGLAVILLIIIILIIIIKKRKSANNSEEYYYSELYSNDDKEEDLQEQIEEDYEEQPKKKKRSKGKRFK